MLTIAGGAIAAGAAAATPSWAPFAVAAIGGLSLLAAAVVPELFKMLRRAVPPAEESAVVTPLALDVLADGLRAELEARISGVRSTANSARSETRALRKALEARDDLLRDRIDAVRAELREHILLGQLPIPAAIIPEAVDAEAVIPAPRSSAPPTA